MKKIIKEMFNDIDGTVSSKRVFTAASVIILIASWVLDVFWKLSVSDYIFDGFLYVVAAGVLGISAEKFVRWRGKDKNSVNDTFEGL